MKLKYLLVGLLLLAAALALAACGQAPPQTTEAAPPPQVQPTQACPELPTPTECPAAPEPVVQNVPFQDEWASSAHADKTAEAFNHWNDADPAEVPPECARCHSTPGYLDYLGADGTAAGTVDNPAPIGTVITCQACHNDVTEKLTSVVFPSGVEVTNLGPQARCMVCHQGRESTVSVNAAVDEAGLTDQPDTVNADLGFINVHYFAAGATRLGSEVHGGYEYAGKSYDPRFDHVDGYTSCNDCHNQHTLKIRVEECSVCHTNVSSEEDLKSIRMNGSLVDYNGNGDITEGIAAEIEGLQGMLLQAIQSYASEVSGTAIAYTPDSHPYFFIDTNANGTVEEDEANRDNAYNAWTPRLLEAAYNYQFSIKDPGAFAHNGKYVIELVYDSIDDLNSKLSTPVDLSNAHRVDAGHFAASEEPFRHWDEEGEVPGTCAKCHTASGLPTFLANGVNIATNPSSGLHCATCHTDLTTFERYEVTDVTMPSGLVVSFEDADANLCITCHQGRESTTSVNAAIAKAGVGDNEVSDKLRFLNPHYFAAGATLWGTQAKGAYEFEGKQYNGRFQHVDKFNSCVECHDTHALTVNVDGCSNCHDVSTVEDLKNVRMTEEIDYDGDGNATEGIGMEVETMQEKLLAAIQAYASSTNGTQPIAYNGGQYPYWFTDANANGQVDEGEEAYATWTPALLRAAYNYQWVTKDPGAFAHNGKYILQIQYDSIQSVGGDVSAMTRPEVTAPEATETPSP